MFTGGVGVNQAYYEAITKDGAPLSKGHMNPLGINTFDKRFMKATFTLTNAVPQYQTSNSGPWQMFETRIRNYAKTCGNRRGTLYLLTGKSGYGLTTDANGQTVQDLAIPLPYNRRNFPGGVTLVTPRAVWTAGCCVWHELKQIKKQKYRNTKIQKIQNTKLKKLKRLNKKIQKGKNRKIQQNKVFNILWKAKSFAVMSNNLPNRGQLHQTEMSVSDLERLLSAPGLAQVHLFPGNGNCRSAQNNIVLL